MITKAEWQALLDGNKIQAKIEEHITKCLQEIFTIYGGEHGTWYYPGAEEGGMGEMRIGFGSISITTECKKDVEIEPEYEDNQYSGYLLSEFPVHFLFLSVDDVRTKVSNYKVKLEKQIAAEEKKKKATAQARKAKKDKLLQSAANKLTAEEKKALGLK